MIDQQAMLMIVSMSTVMIVSLFHDTSTSNVNDRVTIPWYINKQSQRSCHNVNDRVSIPWYINKQCYWSCHFHMIHQQAMLTIVSLFHDISTSQCEWSCHYSMIDQQAMLMIVSLFHDRSTRNVNDRVTIPGYINKQCQRSCHNVNDRVSIPWWSISNVNDRVIIPMHQQPMLMIVSLFHDRSTRNVNDRVNIPWYINKQSTIVSQCEWSCLNSMIHQHVIGRVTFPW